MHAVSAAQAKHYGCIIPLFGLRGFLLLGAVFIAPLAGLLLDLSLDAVIFFFATAFVFYGAYFLDHYLKARRLFRGLNLSAQLPKRLLLDKQYKMMLQLNSAWHSSASLLFRPLLPENLEATEEVLTLRLDAESGARERQYLLRPQARGCCVVESCFLRFVPANGFFLFQVQYRFSQPLCSTVYPNPFGGSTVAQVLRKPNSCGSQPLFFPSTDGREFESLRSYLPQDDLRHVDWKRSARRGSLLVKVHRPDTHQRILLALDCGRRMGLALGKKLQLDYAADLAAELCYLAQENDDEVGLLAFHHQRVSELPCRRGHEQSRLLMERLSQLEVGHLEADYYQLLTWAESGQKRCLLVLITSVATEANLELLRPLLSRISRRHLPLIVAISPRDIYALLDKPPSSLEEAYVAGAAVQQLEAIEKRVGAFQHLGIECIYSDVLRLPKLVAKKYRELKLRGRI